MIVLLDIKESKVPFVIELLDSLTFVKAKPISSYKATVLEDLKDSVDELNQIIEGQLVERNAEDLSDDLKIISLLKIER
jgi:hypothetical protein